MSGIKKLVITFLSVIAVVWATVFYFIPAFRGRITVSPVFHLGSLTVHYYGLIMALAILVSVWLAIKLAPRWSVSPQVLENALPWAVVFGFLGARLYFAAFAWEHFITRPIEVLQIWKGGLSIYGGILGAALGILLYSRKNHLSAGRIFDLAALAAPLGQAIGRFGNFFNEEGFGYPTSLPWRLYISPASRPKDLLAERFFHPAFLYEALWDLLVFLILWKLFKIMTRSSPAVRPGYLFGAYLILYSAGRFFIEGLRLDSFVVSGIRADQATALLMIAGGLAIIIFTHANKTS